MYGGTVELAMSEAGNTWVANFLFLVITALYFLPISFDDVFHDTHCVLKYP